ncbi:heterokaryon incompatibility [Fusarium longipes]|uniref:Heterokaryon incompatibility n=1 Tax=Fusarium longipes TaxID=694270 RepID=A0A395RMN6_9HYPO|nr:heterokaryon incompatibility [Fusarium longipes]
MSAEETNASQDKNNGDRAMATSTPSVVDCDMCSKVIEFVHRPLELQPEAGLEGITLGKVGQLLASNCPHAKWLRDIEFLYGPVPEYEKRSLSLSRWAQSQPCSFDVHYQTRRSSVFSGTPPFEMVFRPEIPRHLGSILIIDKSWIDMDRVKEWPSRCEQLHGEKCNETIGNVPAFTPRLLIDVIQGCVVICREVRPRFLTLSYTWGDTKNFRTTRSNFDEMQKPGVLTSDNVAMQLPATILNAIELTKALGEKWLWVDSLCIIQDDEESLKIELAAMHRIYATSFLTIIAADGKDAEYGLRGLRGISKPRAINQIVESLAGGERIAYWERPQRKTRDTTGLLYNDRMWTSQEYDFSKRRLIFKEGQVKWECNCTKWSEDHIYHTEQERRRKIFTYSYIGHGAELKVPSLARLGRLVQDFNAKTLRFEEDVYGAFSGYNTYLNSIFPSGLVYGLPQLFFDISLCWTTSHNIRRRTPSQRYTGDPLRNGLPSWSWMGWKGITHLPADLEGEVGPLDCGFTEPITEWYAKERPESHQKERINSQWSACRKAPSEYMAEAWGREEFKPDNGRYSTEPRSMPKEMPSHGYYCSFEDNPKHVTRWYPIPLNLNGSNGSQVELHSGFQYLWCQTSHAFLTATQNTIGEWEWLKFYLLEDSSGVTIGALQLHDDEDSKLFRENFQVELIAIAKGWTSILKTYSACSSPGAEADSESEDEPIAMDSSDDELDYTGVEESEPWIERWEEAKKNKQDCYHVLWIEWKNGVAYRKSSGFVLEEEWDRVAEPGKVDITLG